MREGDGLTVASEPDRDDEGVGHEIQQPAVEADVPLKHIHAAELQRGGSESARE